MINAIQQADCGKLPFADNSVDLVVCSPPYEDCRLYDEPGFALTGEAWVKWAIVRYMECLRVSRGLVAWVVEGKTKDFKWSVTPALLMADLHRAGVRLRKPPVFHRVGIPGSGGPDWLRNDYEFIICATKHGKLPWSDNTACGHPPKYPPGGPPSHRTTATRGSKCSDTRVMNAVYKPPKITNPGNVIHCTVGGGQMDHTLAHENEAPFPVVIPSFFIRSFCKPGGLVFDPFCGSGTTGQAAIESNRRYAMCDIRSSQVGLSTRRMASVHEDWEILD